MKIIIHYNHKLNYKKIMDQKISSSGTDQQVNNASNRPNQIMSDSFLLHSDNTIIPNDKQWGEKLRNYQKSKEVFKYDPKVFPKHITTKMINSCEKVFNPITQKYYDPKKEQSNLDLASKTKLTNITNGYDKQLEVESTYDIINLNNKLGYFNYNDEVKKSRTDNSNQFNFEKNNIKPYNIISNLSLKEHNFLPPNLRPSEDALLKSHEGIFLAKSPSVENNINNPNLKYRKDFNIINNKYKYFDTEKQLTEKQIQNLTAMKKMQNMKTYDIIRGKFINPNVEKEWQEKTKKRNVEKSYDNSKMDKIHDKNYIVRNPINHYIYDKAEQKRLDDIEYNKKRRYLVEDELNNYYHSMSNNNAEQKNINCHNYFHPFELILQNKRGYDILTNKEQTYSDNNKYLSDIQNKKMTKDWDKIKINSDQNNSFNNKKIYKQEYDYSDVNDNYNKFLDERKERIKIINDNKKLIMKTPNIKNNLGSLSVDNMKNIPKTNKVLNTDSGVFNNNAKDRIMYHKGSDYMNKNEFFGIPDKSGNNSPVVAK